MADEIALAKARSFQNWGGFVLFGAIGYVVLVGKGIDLTIPLLVMAAGLVLVIAARIDMNVVRRRKNKRLAT